MCSFQLRVFVWIIVPAALVATDVYMYCPPDDWQVGNSVTLNCSVVKSAYPSRCVTTPSYTADFRRSPTATGAYSARCSMADVNSTKCTSSSPDCDCKSHNNTHYNFLYTFTLASDSSGYWDCNIPCQNGITPQLTYSSNDGCKNRTVKASPCDGINCKYGTTCFIKGDGQPQCNCTGTVYHGIQCDQFACSGHEGSAKCAVSDSTPETAEFICDSFTKGFNCADITPCTIFVICACIVVIGLVLFIVYKKCFRIKITIYILCPQQLINALPNPVYIETALENFIRKHCRCFPSCTVRVDFHTKGLIVVKLTFRSIIVRCSTPQLKEIEQHLFGVCVAELSKHSNESPDVRLFSPTEFTSRKSTAGNPSQPAKPNEPAIDYPRTKPQPTYTGKGNSKRQKEKSDKEVALSNVRGSSPPSDSSSNDKTQMIPSTKERPVPIPPSLMSAGIGNSSTRLEPLQSNPRKITSVERDSFPLAPIPSGKSS